MKFLSQPYAALVKLGKDAIRETMAVHRAREMELKGQVRVAELDSKIAEGAQRITELASQYPVDYDKILATMDETALLRRKKEQLELLMGEMFPKAGEPEAS